MKKDCHSGTCYHCKEKLQTKNKKYCPEHFEIYNELFNEFQDFYENNIEEIRITRIKHFKASTRRYIRDYLNSGYDELPISMYMSLNDLSEEYFEKIYRVIHKDDYELSMNSVFDPIILNYYDDRTVDADNIKSWEVQRQVDKWNSLNNFEKFNKLKF